MKEMLFSVLLSLFLGGFVASFVIFVPCMTLDPYVLYFVLRNEGEKLLPQIGVEGGGFVRLAPAP